MTLNSVIAGTDSHVRSSTRSSLRSSAATTVRVRGAGALTGRAPRARPRRAPAAGATSAARPRTRPSTTSASATAPPGSWLTITRVRPEPRPISGSTSSLAAGSRFARGSSSSRSSGSCSSARHTATRCTIPRESVRTGSSARRSIPTAASSSSPRSRATPCSAAWNAQVLARRELAVEQRLVAEQPDPPAHRPALVGQGVAEHAQLAAVRAQQRRQQPQQRALARPVGSEHGEGLSGLDRDADRRERRALAVAARHLVQLKRGQRAHPAGARPLARRRSSTHHARLHGSRRRAGAAGRHDAERCGAVRPGGGRPACAARSRLLAACSATDAVHERHLGRRPVAHLVERDDADRVRSRVEALRAQPGQRGGERRRVLSC